MQERCLPAVILLTRSQLPTEAQMPSYEQAHWDRSLPTFQQVSGYHGNKIHKRARGYYGLLNGKRWWFGGSLSQLCPEKLTCHLVGALEMHPKSIISHLEWHGSEVPARCHGSTNSDV